MTDQAIGRLGDELLALLGEQAFVIFAQTFGGRRLYVPRTIPADHEIARAVGADAARHLSGGITGTVIRVPLARELRARHYRADGKSNGQIASLLGLTETAVDKMFRRMDNPPVKGSAGQLSLFPE